MASSCFLMTFVLLGGVSTVQASVVKLSAHNYEQSVEDGSWFVKFFAPWCTHCKKLAPIWEQLANVAETSEWAVKIAEVDCTVSQELCMRLQIKGYPHLALVTDGNIQAQYNGKMSVNHYEQWLKKLNVLEMAKVAVTPPTIQSPKSILALYICVTLGGGVLVVALCALFHAAGSEEASPDKQQ